MPRASTSIDRVGKKWTVTVSWASMSGGGREVTSFDTFKEAYASVAWRGDVRIDWHPDWMQKQIDEINEAVEKAKHEQDKKKDLEQLAKLKKKYQL